MTETKIELQNINLRMRGEHNHTRSLIKQGVGEILQVIRDNSGRRVDNLPYDDMGNLTNTKAAKEFLDALAFPSMTYRHKKVADRHARTFEWIFKDIQEDTPPWSSFTEWLEDDDSTIYWISGRAGSGKSTLMKYLYGNPRTYSSLKIWAAGIPLVPVGHFFWNSGDSLQMSQDGLLRVLLHEALSMYHELIPIVLPGELPSTSHGWSLPELKEAFGVLVTQEAIQLKLIFFVDGLDEYDGNYTDLAKMFKDYSKFPNVKFCLSSRPLQVFDDCFDGYPSLRLQDLTRSDISLFVSEKIGMDKRILKMRADEPEKVAKLISDIVNKANGVFLWVSLVVKSLLNGLQDRNQLSDLQRRVDILPSELEDLYEHMLGTIDVSYHHVSSSIFQVFRASGDSIETLNLYFATQVDVNSALRSPITPRPIEDLLQMCDDMKVILKTRCAGLLECSDDPDLTSHVVYIHRTAREFLEQPKILKKLEEWSEKELDPWALLLLGRVFALKIVCRYEYPGSMEALSFDPWKEVKTALAFASCGPATKSTIKCALLDEINKAMEVHWSAWLKSEQEEIFSRTNVFSFFKENNAWTTYVFTGISETFPIYNYQSSMLSLAVQAGIVDYVIKKTEHNDLIRRNPGRPLLDFTLNCKEACHQASEEMIAYLLEHGASPNERFGPDNMTPWENALKCFHGKILVGSDTVLFEYEDFLLKWVRIYTMLVQSGADPNAYCGIETDYVKHRGYTTVKYYSVLEFFKLKLDKYSYNDGWTPFCEAREPSLEELEKLAKAISNLQQVLVENGAKSNIILGKDWKGHKFTARMARKDNKQRKSKGRVSTVLTEGESLQLSRNPLSKLGKLFVSIKTRK